MKKMTIIFTSAGILVATLSVVAQGPAVTAPAQTNQASHAAAVSSNPAPQQPAATNQTGRSSSTNTPSSSATSTNSKSASNTGSATSTPTHQITIIRGTDASTSGGISTDQIQLPPNGNGVEAVKSTAGTPSDWRSDGSKPHVIPPRPPTDNP